MAHLSIAVPFLIVACLYVSVSAAIDEQHLNAKAQLRLQAQARVEKINKSQKRWKAELNSRFADQSKEEMSRWLGLRVPPPHIKAKAEKMVARKQDIIDAVDAVGRKTKRPRTTRVPTTPTTPSTTPEPTTPSTTPEPEEEPFDSREEWPECADVIGLIQDQSRCGSCWAVSSASVMSDRTCIGSGGAQKVNISAEDILSCETQSSGCNGGYAEAAFAFWQDHGVCTGSDYPTKQGCKPYPIPPHADHDYDTPKCRRRCENRKYNAKYVNDKYYGQNAKTLEGDSITEEDIMDAIFEGGPVEAGMMVYDDLFHYKSGVYEKSDDAEKAGGHAVRIIGWGTEENEEEGDDIPYWLVANSWGADWGMDGYFKIVRGQDECFIESWGVNFAEAKLDNGAAVKKH